MEMLVKSFEQPLSNSDVLVAVEVAVQVHYQTVLLRLFAVQGELLHNSEEQGLIAIEVRSDLGALTFHYSPHEVVGASCWEGTYPEEVAAFLPGRVGLLAVLAYQEVVSFLVGVL
jgi:hypothetical protein